MDTAAHIGNRPLGRGTFAGVLITIAMHGAIGGMVYLSQIRSPPAPEAARDLITTKLVTLGKPREKFWLPRIVEPPKPKIEQPVLKVTEDPEAKPAVKEAPKPEDAEISKDLRRALNRAKMLAKAAGQEELEEGSLTGSTEGTSSTATEGDEYATKIKEAIRRNWVAPTLINDAQLAGLEVEIRVRITEDGLLQEPSLKKSSGNQIYDDSCMQAVKATGRVPPIPASQRALYRRGVVLPFGGSEMSR